MLQASSLAEQPICARRYGRAISLFITFAENATASFAPSPMSYRPPRT